jgi:hypothetical protein
MAAFVKKDGSRHQHQGAQKRSGKDKHALHSSKLIVTPVRQSLDPRRRETVL